MSDTTEAAGGGQEITEQDEQRSDESSEEDDDEVETRFSKRIKAQKAAQRKTYAKKADPEVQGDEKNRSEGDSEPQKSDEDAETDESDESDAKSDDEESEKGESGTEITLKIDGKEEKVDLEKEFPGIAPIWPKLTDEQRTAWKTKLQKGIAADRRFASSAKAIRDAQALVKALQTKPLDVLKHPSLGIPADKLREMLESELYEHVKLEQMDPKEREIHELRHQLKMKEEADKRAKEEAEKKEIEEMTTRYQDDYRKGIIEAIEASGLPKAPLTVQRYAHYLKMALSRGTRLKPEQVTDLVRDDLIKLQREMYGSLESDKLVELLGQDVVTKLRKADAKNVKASKKPPQPMDQRPTPKRRKANPMTWSEWRERNRARKAGEL